jgi:hypothetical protein
LPAWACRGILPLWGVTARRWQSRQTPPPGFLKKKCRMWHDSVLNTYSGWAGEDELFEPRPGLRLFLERLRGVPFDIVVHSTRDPGRIVQWLKLHGLAGLVGMVVDRKPKAICYLDDRGIRFDGDFAVAFDAIVGFRAFWEKPGVAPG